MFKSLSMEHQSNANSSSLTKLRQAYWEAKHNLNNSLGTNDDDCWISSDSDLNTRIELLQEADKSYNSVLKSLLQYKDAICTIMVAEEKLGTTLVDYGIKDTTNAGKLMVVSGTAITESANQRSPLKSQVDGLYHEVQTFHLKATVDVFQTVNKMEKFRKSYRSGLLWLKNESQNLDPDDTKKLKKFRKVQEHIKHLKKEFDAAKLESMQKIDLYLLSRCNLFSKSLVPYCEVFCIMNMNYAIVIKSAVKKFPSHSYYKFETLKELNEYSTTGKGLKRFQSSKLKSGSKGLYEKNSNSKGILKSTAKCTKSPSTRSVIVKKVRFKDPFECKPTSENSITTIKTILIDLNDEGYLLVQDKTQMQDSNVIPGKYSKDLLSIQLDNNASGDNIKKSDQNQNTKDEFEKMFLDLAISQHPSEDEEQDRYKNIEDHFQKCFGLLDTVIAQNPSEQGSDLHFWSLIDDQKDSREEVLTKCETTITPANNHQKDCSSQWENILMEFDPYSENISRFVKESTFTEDC